MADSGRASTLRELVDALDTAVVGAVVGDPSAVVSSVALVDGAELADGGPAEEKTSAPDVCVHVGVRDDEELAYFAALTGRPASLRPRAVLSKTASPEVHEAARSAGVAFVEVHPRARWDHVFPRVQRMLDRSHRQPTAPADPDLLAADTDLFDLAQSVARNAGGMVSIEDAASRVLAHSPSDETADELRTLSILGREGPRDYLRVLHRWGVYDRLRTGDEVVDVPEHAELGTKRRLVVGIREPADDGETGRTLGSIWLQQGEQPFSPDAADVLRGAAAIAARIIVRTHNAPSTEEMLIQRLFGLHGEGVDVPSLAGALNLPSAGPVAVIGFAASEPGRLGRTGSVLRLHASAFRRDSVTTMLGDRAYVLLPGYSSQQAVAAWARQLVGALEETRSVVLRAAIAGGVARLGDVAAARAEVDRVLDGTADTPPQGRVTTLAESRTAVLLGEILDMVGSRPEMHDPRVDALGEYDDRHGTELRASAAAFLACHGDVRSAAERVRVHPNTLRYRLRRVEQLTGLDLRDSSDRLLLELQLAVRLRHR
ncbi:MULTISPECIES: PucR family transcriptional regulator [Prauserella salsuginis group]|uniref:PucR family transcriptional regulator n=1 Tax=Prauserella salsuginis TaxID=387889 RepID=A0ABW6G588_9PSEU|nr:MULTISPECIES: helix-turn-helix domain-containing protein [Prauserella salsuginis group]MCR3718898.1 PucR C-terminal helix-turn-helix domain-containing protein [Prauserella flava]MCR3733468.1 PucR C-terminal helix-turn-helix domain-containing protein [Prauserella salsuginis]